MTVLLVLVGSSIIMILTGIAAYLHFKLYKQRKKVSIAEKEQQQKLQQKTQQRHQDIQFLARAYLEDQVELNEVSIRIHQLANFLELNTEERKPYSVFDTIAEQLQHVPTHNGWKTLDKSTRISYQALFESLNKEHRENAKLQAEGISKLAPSTLIH
ncbi:MAG: hypothetical protein ACI93R_001706 [Flavobacteriales bacterium]|jgi:hypothetical protein